MTLLPPLAEPNDAARLGYQLPAGAEAALLDRASTRIRRAAGQPITRRSSTARLAVDEHRVKLVAPPVVEVTRVEYIDDTGLPVALTGWRWDGADRLTLPDRPALLVRLVEVTYTHGFDPIPDELVDLCCAVASRLADTPAGMEAGIRQQSIDNYSVTYAAEQIATSSGLLPGEEKALASIVPVQRAQMVKCR
ncbi:hypothetical protein ACN20G_28185 (plasmid) [Streptomyces sp. BI20]|uniref:hypothetical protein n=1 Tax=Streptomyces sp. BI20 TaxID=3403460 RepID=UPI003C72EAFE